MEPVHEGRCACGSVHYKVHGSPMFVHCCHCSYCQRQSGAAFALNAMVEADRVEVTQGKPEPVKVPSPSGKGQVIWRCPACRTALWSHYGGAGDLIDFIRVGTLEDPAAMPPDIHIYTSTKQPWVTLDDGKPQMDEFYDRRDYWPAASLDRLKAVIAKAKG